MQQINNFIRFNSEDLTLTTNDGIFIFYILGIHFILIGGFFSFFLFYRLRKRLKELDNQKIIVR